MPNAKRILNVTVKHMPDSDGDTSYLGEYSDTRSSRFSIDRKHSAGCQSLNPSNDSMVEKLERAIGYLDEQRLGFEHSGEDYYENLARALEDAQDILIEAQERVTECDCDESGDMERGQYRYFNPSSNYIDDKDNPEDELTEDEVRKYVSQDYKRMEAYNSDQWAFIGIRAVAEISIDGTVQTITSGGLWSIETDSEPSYFEEVGSEELSQLRKQLAALGFSKRSISVAFKSVETE